MAKRTLIFAALVIFLISLNGCAGARKQKDLEIQGLRNQVSVLESQVESKDAEISALRDALNKEQMDKEAPEVSRRTLRKKMLTGEIKSRPKAKQIQLALQNAGFYSGSIDGRLGRQTREAIKAFQRANGLAADGKVGKQTWNLLREYLYKKLK